jgi:prepilin-type N-terminal cleavage/methylation domain-containing protein
MLKRYYFTLIELLVVIAIIAILITNAQILWKKYFDPTVNN